MLPLWLPLLVKAVTTALVVVTASVLAEAFGPVWGALIASLPISGGPAFLFLAMRQSTDFVAHSALASFANNAATCVYLVAYVLAGRTGPPWRGLAVAVLAWSITSVAIHAVDWTASTALVLNLVVYAGGLVCAHRLMPSGVTLPPGARRRWYELPVRGAMVGIFVTAVVALSTLLGAGATGVVAVFPISLSSILAVVRPRIGAAAACVLALTALRTMLGFGLALLTLHLTIIPLGAPTGLLLALGVSLVLPLGMMLWRAVRSAA